MSAILREPCRKFSQRGFIVSQGGVEWSMLRTSLPALYDGFLDPKLLALTPRETLATCGTCYKAQKSAPAPHYDAQLKCCTFYPFLPNYLVGGVLSDSRPELQEGRERVRQVIRERRFALPIGVCAPPGYQALFRSKSAKEFGQNRDLLCPFYAVNTGGCTVWAYRGHECSTFFCASSYAEKGEKFWRELREHLFAAEMHLSQNALVQKGYTPREIDENLEFVKRHEDDVRRDRELSALEWNRLWAHHQDDIEGFYKACFQFVSDCKSELKKAFYDDRSRAKPIDPRVFEPLFLGGALPAPHRNR